MNNEEYESLKMYLIDIGVDTEDKLKHALYIALDGHPDAALYLRLVREMEL